MRLVGSVFAAGALGLGVAACAACDRVSEPGTSEPPRPLTTTATATGEATARCVKKWGAKAKREPFLQGFVAPDCPDKGDDLTPPAPTEPLRTATIVFPEAAKGGGAAPSVTVEIADAGPTRQRGLMMRKSMPENLGMIFVFEERRVQEFWMHNTCIPLDMMFIDKDGFITGIEENVPTMNDNTYGSGCASTYVLEVNAGWARRHGVEPGQTAKLEGL